MAGPVLIDAKGAVLGRLATNVAKRLLNGEEVVVVNAELAIITGGREDVLAKYKFKRDVGGARKGPLYPRMPHLMLKRTVRGMLPYKTSHGREAYKNLKVHISVPAELKGKELQTVKEALGSTTQRFMTLGDVSRVLGAKWEVKE